MQVMKKLFVLALVIILVTGCTTPPPETHQVEIGFFTPYWRFPETLKGKVKTMTEKTFLAVEKDGMFVKNIPVTVEARDTIGCTSDFMVAFDQDGNMLESVNIDENGEVIEQWELTVDAGRAEECEYIEKDTLKVLSRLTYDDQGVLVKIENFRMPVDTLMGRGMMGYDENGFLTELQFRNSKDENTGKYIFAVNADGKRTGYKFYNKEGEQTFEEQFTYDDNGDLIKQVMINKKGESSETEYKIEEYDKLNNWTSCLWKYTGVVLITERIYTYYEE
jgi:hypothetical protein